VSLFFAIFFWRSSDLIRWEIVKCAVWKGANDVIDDVHLLFEKIFFGRLKSSFDACVAADVWLMVVYRSMMQLSSSLTL
jgi:uncharacterized membrane protein YpjA